jgi:hypothetical protein
MTLRRHPRPVQAIARAYRVPVGVPARYQSPPEPWTHLIPEIAALVILFLASVLFLQL